MRQVVVTGAAGGVAGQILPLLRAVYPQLVLTDRVEPEALAPPDRFVAADLTDAGALEQAVAGADGIVHLGGFSVEGPWQPILEANIVGCHNLFEAARRQNVGRVVFASSNHAIGFYPRSSRIDRDDRVRPDGRYGVSKAFGEALGSLYADKHGLRVLSIRIGNVAARPIDHRRLSIWIHPEDLVQLIRIGLEHPGLRNEVLFGASDNERSWWDNGAARRLGYRPRHRAEDHAAYALAEQARLEPDPVGDRFQGGSYCAIDFAGDLEGL